MLYPCSGVTLAEVITSMFDGELNNVQPCMPSDWPADPMNQRPEENDTSLENDN